jgi:hypothetical protein
MPQTDVEKLGNAVGGQDQTLLIVRLRYGAHARIVAVAVGRIYGSATAFLEPQPRAGACSGFDERGDFVRQIRSQFIRPHLLQHLIKLLQAFA